MTCGSWMGLPNINCDSQRLFGLFVTCSLGSEVMAILCINLLQLCLSVVPAPRNMEEGVKCKSGNMGGML